MFRKISYAVVVLCIFPVCALGNDLNLKAFLAPSDGVKNTYSCKFPCEYIEISGDIIKTENTLNLKEVFYFSDKLTKNNPQIPKFILNRKKLHLLGDRIIDGDKKTGNILLKTPIEKNTSWKISGVMETVIHQNDMSNLKKNKISWTCGIVSIGKENLFMKDRDIVTVKCVSNFSPMEIVWWRYATGIGLIENKTEHIEDNNIKETIIMTIMKSEEKGAIERQ